MRIDGHQHFWTTERDDYGWLTPALEPLYRDFTSADLAPLLDAAGIDQTVLVQAAANVAETRYLLSIADNDARVAGVVGWVDLESHDAALADLSEFAQHPKFVGIRPMLQDIEDVAWIERVSHHVILDALIDRNLTFDALVRSEHLPHLSRCLARHPSLRVIVDHGAKPNIAGSEWQPWADAIARIAEETTAYCKISGLITEANATQTYDDVRPYFDHLLAVFGPGRLVWGSDWPVLCLAGDYEGWYAASTELLNRLSAQDQDNILGLNAIRFYGLNVGGR